MCDKEHFYFNSYGPFVEMYGKHFSWWTEEFCFIRDLILCLTVANRIWLVLNNVFQRKLVVLQVVAPQITGDKTLGTLRCRQIEFYFKAPIKNNRADIYCIHKDPFYWGANVMLSHTVYIVHHTCILIKYQQEHFSVGLLWVMS